MTPSDLEYITRWYGMGRGTDPSVTPLVEYGESEPAQRFDPFRAGLSPSEIEYFTKTYAMGRGTDPSVIPLVEYGESEPTKVIVFGKVIHR